MNHVYICTIENASDQVDHPPTFRNEYTSYAIFILIVVFQKGWRAAANHCRSAIPNSAAESKHICHHMLPAGRALYEYMMGSFEVSCSSRFGRPEVLT